MASHSLKTRLCNWLRPEREPPPAPERADKADEKQESKPAYVDRGARLSLAVGEDVFRRLHQIPSETTHNERQFLYQFFRRVWGGENHVVEIGPFLGGTTRAIALGMQSNPRARDGAALFTFDKFSDYYTAENLREYLKPLLESGALREDDLGTEDNPSAFLEIFVKLHSPHEYFQRIQPRSLRLPDTPEQATALDTSLMPLPDDCAVDAVFVDGCKGWFATRSFMESMVEFTPPGSFFIFQDYGWYTCFWISAFIEIFHDHFDRFAHVDNTYTFVLTRSLTSDAIGSRFPPTPGELSESELIAIFERRVHECEQNKDPYGAFRCRLHQAAALAYIGNLDAAKNRINALSERPEAAEHSTVIASALKSPTYTPTGSIYFND